MFCSEAMGHFLTALELQQSSTSCDTRTGTRTVMSDNLWSAVSMTLKLLERSDLQFAVDTRDINPLLTIFSPDSTA